MKITYSEFKNYLECPKKYKLFKDKAKPPFQPNKYFAIYGMTIQKFFQYYTNYYLKQGSISTPEQIKSKLKIVWDKILTENYVDWTDVFVRKSDSEIFEDVYNDILANIKAFDFFKKASSEVKLTINLKNSGDVIVSKLDFVYTDDSGEIIILDGKGTDKIGNVDIDQLYFYALVYLLHHGKLPNKLGFLYWKYQKIDYLTFTRDDIVKFKNKLALVKKTIKEDKIFAANVGLSKSCKYCPYTLVCEECIAKRASNKEKKVAKGLSIGADQSGDIVSLGL